MHVGIIPARAASKRLPNKNILPLWGAPTLSWTVQAAILSRLDWTVLSTEDPTIAMLGHACGVPVIRRPSHLASDDAGALDVLLHACTALDLDDDDAVMLLQPSSPLRHESDIDDALALLTPDRAVVSCREAEQQPNGAIYLTRVGLFREHGRMHNPLYMPMPGYRSVDIDTREDYLAAWEAVRDHCHR